MKEILILVVGLLILGEGSDSFMAYVGAGIIAWSYYRSGQRDGFQSGKRAALGGKTKFKK